MSWERRRSASVVDWERVWVLVRGEVAEEFQGRSLLTLLVACGVFSLALNGLYSQLVETVASMMGPIVGAEPLAAEPTEAGLRRLLAANVGGDAAELLHRMGPRSMLYGYCTFLFVQGLALLLAPGVIAQDVDTGASRYLLVRVSRPTYWVAKWGAIALRLALGLAVGLAVAVSFSVASDPAGPWSEAWWLTVVSGWAWVCGLSFAGVFMAVSLLFRSPGKARLAAFLLNCGAWYAHLWGVGSGIPEPALLLLPQSHVDAFWGPPLGRWLGLVALMLIAVLPPVGAGLLFQRRDA